MGRNENPAVPEPLRDLAREFWAKGVRGARFLTDGDTLAPIPGAYVLVVDLARPLALSLPGKAPVTLGPGRYFYAGSAHGTGGIKARGSRHMRKRKALRWHIDHSPRPAPSPASWRCPRAVNARPWRRSGPSPARTCRSKGSAVPIAGLARRIW